MYLQAVLSKKNRVMKLAEIVLKVKKKNENVAEL